MYWLPLFQNISFQLVFLFSKGSKEVSNNNGCSGYKSQSTFIKPFDWNIRVYAGLKIIAFLSFIISVKSRASSLSSIAMSSQGISLNQNSKLSSSLNIPLSLNCVFSIYSKSVLNPASVAICCKSFVVFISSLELEIDEKSIFHPSFE